MVDFSSVLTAKWVQFPQPMHFGIKFEPSSCVAIAVLFAISSIQAIGDFFSNDDRRNGPYADG